MNQHLWLSIYAVYMHSTPIGLAGWVLRIIRDSVHGLICKSGGGICESMLHRESTGSIYAFISWIGIMNIQR